MAESELASVDPGRNLTVRLEVSPLKSCRRGTGPRLQTWPSPLPLEMISFWNPLTAL